MKPGDIIDNRFRLESVAGRGGMGEVWKATDLEKSQRVAFKILISVRPPEKARILREAKALSTLEHPHIVRYIAHGILNSEDPYLVMEWLEGEDLSKRLERGPLSVDDSIRAMRRACQALAFTHQRGVVHRDIKPSNIWLSQGNPDAVKILDYGLAQVQVEDDLGKLTKAGIFIGTPAYTSPEQAHALQAVDARADIFSLGCVFFECLAGRPPFMGDGALSIMLKILLEAPPSLRDLRPDVPSELEALIYQMLEKEPAHRPQDAALISSQLASLQPSGDVVIKKSLTENERQFICVMLAKDVFSSSQKNAATVVQEQSPQQRNASQETRFLLRDMQQLVGDHGGKLYPVAGGALAVLFRGGVATDQAQKAGRCALALQQKAPHAKVALAIHRGAVRSPIGEVIERAAKLLQSAHPEEQGILLDESSAGLFEARFEVESGGPNLFLKGSRPLALAKKTLLGKPTPFLGREDEVTWLLESAEDSFLSKTAKIVSVNAEAGMGKSRLLLEFLERIGEREEGVPLILFAQADSGRSGSPFSLLSGAIRRYAGILEGEPIEVQRQKLYTMVCMHVVQSSASQPNMVRLSGGLSLKPAVNSYPAQTRVTEFLGELCGIQFPSEKSAPLRMARQSAQVMGEQMRRALEDWLSAEVQARPVLMIIEDLHVGDVPSVGFLDSALHRLRRTPFFLLTLSRPELREAFPVLWSTHQVFDFMLTGISEEACKEFVMRVLEDKATPELAARLAAKSRGNPFYLEELCRSVSYGDGREIPETILAMTQSRLERLSIEQRKILRAASILGESFWSGGIERLLGGEKRDSIDEALPVLAEAELITLKPDSRFSNELEYCFQNTLLRESLYASLTPEDLELGHGLAAEWLLEKQESDEWILAEHFARGPEPHKASSWYATSAQHSFEGNDLQAALYRIKRAVECGASGEALASLTLLEGEVLLWQGRYHDAVPRFEEAMNLLERGGILWYKSTAGLVATSFYTGRYDLLFSLMETLREVDPASEVSGIYAMATSTIVIFSCIAGVYVIATEFLNRLEDLIKKNDSPDPALLAWTNFSWCYVTNFIQGDPLGFVRSADNAVTGFAQIGDLRAINTALTELGRAHAQIGEYEEAERVLQMSLEQSARQGVDSVPPISRQFLATVLLSQGKVKEAKEYRLLSLEGFRAQNNKQMMGLVMAEHAAILLQEHDLKEAQKFAEEGLSALDMVPPFRSRALARLAEVYLAQNDIVKAVTTAKEAKEVMDSLGGMGYGETFVWLMYLKALQATKAPEFKTEKALAQKRLLERASFLSDERRVLFLEEVPENAALMAL